MSKTPYNPLSLQTFILKYSTQEACLASLEQRRWPKGFVCPHCDGRGGYRLGLRRGYECRVCHKQSSVTTGTVLANAKLPLPKLFLAIYLISTNKQGMSSKSLAKHLSVSEVTSWHLLHKLRVAMMDRDTAYQIGGLIEADEAYVGGLANGAGTRGRSTKHKTPVLAMVEKRGDNLTGYVHLVPLK
jgi:transposase-like protein